MSSLGSFGTPREAEDVTFEWFDKTIRVNPSFGELDLADFMEMAGGVDETHVSEAMTLLKGSMRAVVHEDDFDEFWTIAKRERQDADDVMKVYLAVVEMVTDRPTERASDSSDGPQPTATSSEDDSSSRVIARLVDEGRPSIAYMVRQRSLAISA